MWPCARTVAAFVGEAPLSARHTAWCLIMLLRMWCAQVRVEGNRITKKKTTVTKTTVVRTVVRKKEVPKEAIEPGAHS